jgi:hypothetical protein
MVERRSPKQSPDDEPRTLDQLAVLYSDCIEAFRRDAAPEVWHQLDLRIAEFQQRFERQFADAGERVFRDSQRTTSR